MAVLNNAMCHNAVTTTTLVADTGNSTSQYGHAMAVSAVPVEAGKGEIT